MRNILYLSFSASWLWKWCQKLPALTVLTSPLRRIIPWTVNLKKKRNPFFPYVALVGVFPHSSRTETKTHISVHVSLRPTSGNVMYGNKLPLLWKVKTRFAFQNFFPTIIWTQVYGIRKPLHTFTFSKKFDIFQLSIIGTVQSYPLPQRKH